MKRYLSKISGPLLDRIDIHIKVTRVPFEKLSEERKGEGSVAIRERVTKAREYCQLAEASKLVLKNAMERLNLSARAYDCILKVARTIADIAGAKNVDGNHIDEAIQYRGLDREGWLG